MRRCCSRPVDADTVHRFQTPSRSPANTIRSLSGAHECGQLLATEEVTRRKFEPSRLTTQICSGASSSTSSGDPLAVRRPGRAPADRPAGVSRLGSPPVAGTPRCQTAALVGHVVRDRDRRRQAIFGHLARQAFTSSVCRVSMSMRPIRRTGLGRWPSARRLSGIQVGKNWSSLPGASRALA